MNKKEHSSFKEEIEALLPPEIQYNQHAAFDWLKNKLIEKAL